jgi:hypothetical protein
MVRVLRDAVTVTAQLEARHSFLMKEDSIWLVRWNVMMKRWNGSMKGSPTS